MATVLLSLLMGLAFLGMAALCLVGGLLTFPKALATRKWTPTTGQILVSKFQRYGYPHIEYSYTVMGKTYTSTQVYYYGSGWFRVSPDEMEWELVEQHAEGASVAVYYNPDHPQEAVLQTGVNTKWLVLDLIAGVAALVIGIAALASALR